MQKNESSPAIGLALDPQPLMALSTAYWSSQTLFTAIRLGVFEQLASGARTAESLAAALGANPRSMRLLLLACVGLGLLEQDANGFRNSALSQRYLVPGTDYYLGNAFRYCDDLYAPWTRLGDAVLAGAPAIAPTSYLGADKERTRHFVYGMHNRALAIGKAMSYIVNLAGHRRLLDVGGGPGTFSALFVQRYPELQAQVLDLPEVVSIANEIIHSLGVNDRVKTMPGDYRTTPFPGGNDVVLISGVFHRESEATCRDLIRRSAQALVPGGMLVISDVFTDADGATPPFAALFGLNMLLTAEHGGVHADANVSAWMQDAGLTNATVTPFPPPMPHRVVVGWKE